MQIAVGTKSISSGGFAQVSDRRNLLRKFKVYPVLSALVLSLKGGLLSANGVFRPSGLLMAGIATDKRRRYLTMPRSELTVAPVYLS